MPTLFSEIEEGSQLPALMVSSEHKDGLRERYFQGEDKDHDLYGKMASVNIVTQKQISSLTGFAACFRLQEFEKIIILTMYIAHNSDRIFNCNHISFLLYMNEQVLKMT